MDQATAVGEKRIRKWTSPLAVLFALYAIFFLPFWQPLVLAFVFAAACTPLVNYIRFKLHGSQKTASYILMAVLTTFVVGIFSVGAIRAFSLLYTKFQNVENVGPHFDQLGEAKTKLIEWMKHVPFLNDQNVESQVNQGLTSLINQAKVFSIDLGKAFVVQTPAILLNFFIFLAAFGVLLLWGHRKWHFISNFFSKDEPKDYSKFHHFERVCAISIGSIFLTGLMQASIVAIGAGITGYPIFLCFLFTFILSLIPVLGAASLPVVLAIMSFATGSTSHGIILLVTALIAGTSDNILRAWLFSKAANTNPVVSLLALLGGISLFGFPGLFLAPIVEQLVMTYLFRDPNMKVRKENEVRSWRRFYLRSRPRPV